MLEAIQPETPLDARLPNVSETGNRSAWSCTRIAVVCLMHVALGLACWRLLSRPGLTLRVYVLLGFVHASFAGMVLVPRRVGRNVLTFALGGLGVLILFLNFRDGLNWAMEAAVWPIMALSEAVLMVTIIRVWRAFWTRRQPLTILQWMLLTLLLGITLAGWKLTLAYMAAPNAQAWGRMIYFFITALVLGTATCMLLPWIERHWQRGVVACLLGMVPLCFRIEELASTFIAAVVISYLVVAPLLLAIGLRSLWASDNQESYLISMNKT